MVHRTPKPSPLTIASLIFAFIAGILCATFVAKYTKEEIPTPENNVIEEPEEIPEEEKKPELIDFQPTLDSWLKTLPKNAKVGAEIFDLDNDQIVAEYNKETIFPTESLYKLPVVYEGYREVEQGIENSETRLTKNYTYSKCLDLAIRESNSTCAEIVLSRIGKSELDKTIKNTFNLQNTNIFNLTSTPSDITEMMKIYYNHKELSEETWKNIQDSMLNQPPVNNGNCDGPCNWRQGLPSGFKTAKVYDKVGWRYGTTSWASYHDTAIVDFETQNRHYIITIMTSNLNFKEISKFGSMIEDLVLSTSA